MYCPGPEFEGRIKLNEANNTKFNFLNRLDPYHAYYEHKIKEIREGVAQEMAAAQQLGYVVSDGGRRSTLDSGRDRRKEERQGGEGSG